MPQRITVTVGVHASEGAEPHRDGGPANDITPRVANDTGKLTVADIATIHEFGAGHIPQRSFVRAWFDESQDFIARTLTSQMALVAAGKLTAEVAAERIALAFEGSMKERVARGIPPPNAAITIARKGSSIPLIATGQLRAAIRAHATVEMAGSGAGGTELGEAAE